MQAEQKKLFDYIHEIGFSQYDLLLYLDTHPDDAEALSYYRQLTEARKNAVYEYQKKFAPLRAENEPVSGSNWKWSTTPWPWERGFY